MQRYLQSTIYNFLIFLAIHTQKTFALIVSTSRCYGSNGRVCDLSPGEEPVGVHAALPLDLDLAPHLAVVAAQVVQQHLGLVRHLDLHGLAGGLHPVQRVK